MAAWTDITMVGLGQRVATHPGGTATLYKDLDGTPLGAALAGAGNPVTHSWTAGFGLAGDQRAMKRRSRHSGTTHDQRPGRDASGHDKNPSRQLHNTLLI
ncbi:MAG: hypothetical protein ACD_23C01403G0002 [uncultured bacterium]|nr:MAG: hypothetical protein ACD_23C01403G0002 [uncultured bacterium]